MKTKTEIQLKWDKKLNDIIKSANYRYRNQFSRKAVKMEADLEKAKEKMEKKLRAYINKKTLEYNRKCANEIRKAEWKPQREYKSTKKLNLLEFAMDLAQENAKLRDTDENGNGRCVSCIKFCSWDNLHWGHWFSRKVKNICLHPLNINAQCKSCNLATWPLGNVDLKERTQAQYEATLIERYWEEPVSELKQRKTDYYRVWYRCNGDYGQGDIELKEYIEFLLHQNDSLWGQKNFYKPKKNWWKIREKEVWTK